MDRPALPDALDTDRLQLRPWQLGDVEDVFSYANDEEWGRYLHAIPFPYERVHAEQFIARQILLDRVTHPAWAVTLDGHAMGGINVGFTFEHAVAEMGYSIARRHWNKGLCTEAARAVLDAAFSVHEDLNRLRAFADGRNTASQRVMEKLGMTKEGVLRQNRVENGVVMDEAWYGILRPEWEALGQSGPAA